MSSEPFSPGPAGEPWNVPLEMDSEAFRRPEETFSLLVSSVKDYAIFMLDPNGFVATWNEGAQRIKGYSAKEIIGKHFSTFYTEEAKQRRHPEYELKIAIREGRYEEEGWRVRKDGSTFWANVVITKVERNGILVGFAKVTRDLTERRIIELEREEAARIVAEKNAELEEVAAQLAQSNEELQRLAYIISHELQAPISTISLYCNLLTVRYRDRLGGDANDFMSRMKTGSELIARMIDDLWTYARITKPGQEVTIISTKNVLQDALEQLEGKVSESQLTVGELPTIEGNKQQLTFLFRELLLNSVMYRSEQEPHIEIDAQQQGAGWLFSFKDNGLGIEPIYASEVFQMYHRLKGGPEAAATGMGLSICKRIVEYYHGRIWFESDGLGLGTTFYFWIPFSRKLSGHS